MTVAVHRRRLPSGEVVIDLEIPIADLRVGLLPGPGMCGMRLIQYAGHQLVDALQDALLDSAPTEIVVKDPFAPRK